jgi:alpha-beta hydrolase superfamily lysophospholipase
VTRRLGWTAVMTAVALMACSDGDGGQSPVDEGDTPVVGCTDGTTEGSLTRVCFPAEWNGDLIVYAHGYVEPQAPLAVPENVLADMPVEDLVNALGYAYATTSYHANGLVADAAVDDLVELVEYVQRTVRPDPARVYLVGASEGGLVATLAVEGEPERFTGALAACGPIGDFARQIDYFIDVRVVFDYLFPDVLPGTASAPPAELVEGWTSTYAPAVAAAIEGDPERGAELAVVTGIPDEGFDAAALAETVVALLRYNVLGSADAQARLGGQPYDNADRVYVGSGDDEALNAGVERIAADAQARAALQRFETTGDPGVPLSLLHTTGDPIIPFFHQPLYQEKAVAAGGAGRLARRDVERFGHCAFTSTEILAAFGELPQ